MTRSAITTGDKRGGAAGSWQKVKFDRQIVAIAKVTGCGVIYSEDEDVRRLAERVAISTVTLSQVPEPPTPPQLEMNLRHLEPPSDPDDEAG